MTIYERAMPRAARYDLAFNISERRRAACIGQIAIAKLAGVGRNTVQRIEYGDHVEEDLRNRVLAAMDGFEELKIKLEIERTQQHGKGR